MDRCDDCGHVIDCVGNCKCPPKEPWSDFLLPNTAERIVRSVHTAEVLLIRGEQFSDGLYRLVIPQDSSDALETAVRKAMEMHDAERITGTLRERVEVLEGTLEDLLNAISATTGELIDAGALDYLSDEFQRRQSARGVVPFGLPRKLTLDEMKGGRRG